MLRDDGACDDAPGHGGATAMVGPGWEGGFRAYIGLVVKGLGLGLRLMVARRDLLFPTCTRDGMHLGQDEDQSQRRPLSEALQ